MDSKWWIRPSSQAARRPAACAAALLLAAGVAAAGEIIIVGPGQMDAETMRAMAQGGGAAGAPAASVTPGAAGASSPAPKAAASAAAPSASAASVAPASSSSTATTVTRETPALPVPPVPTSVTAWPAATSPAFTAPKNPSLAAATGSGPDAWARDAAAAATAAAQQAFGGRSDVRVEVEPGQLDPRLRLAPCDQVQTYLPPGQRAWGRSRIGLRCLSGRVRWNVSIPMTIRVLAPALVTRQAVQPNTVLTDDMLVIATTDWAERESPVIVDLEAVRGRQISQALPAGTALRASHLKLRQWFGAGDPVRLVVKGEGYAASVAATALQAGQEGQRVHVRTDAGKQVIGVAVGPGEVALGSAQP